VREPVALLLTDLVGSAALEQQLGDRRMAALWQAHDRLARDLLREWRGREIDKTDGFLLLFAQAADALGYALAYHRALAGLGVALEVPLKARAGLHVGQVSLRENPAADVALGAKPVEVDGVSKPLAARVMSTALGGQTLLTAAALHALGDALGDGRQHVVSHGHWRVQGLPLPLELFEVGDEGAPFTPPPDSPKVYRVVRQGELWLPAREVAHSLPAERDDFVGRRHSLYDLALRFDRGARLVSLLAIGGCGKTRLATHFGWAWMGEYPGGVWFCDLAPARSVEGICSAVAQGLQVPLGGEDPLLQLGHAIAGRGHCLVILDNFEQVARHAEASVGRWLERAAQARFLVTTREVLGIAGEETLALPPLPAPDAETLFQRRAAAARADFHPTPDDADDEAAIAPLVRLLDGLPLAIELAAARVRTLAPRALLARMSERFKLLASSGGRLDRQATLRATFDWSWDLLSAAEKAALAQLAVFEGGFNLEAAEAVIALAPGPDMPWTLDVVHSLVEKSFVRPLGAQRFDLLVSVQAYAMEHLQTAGRWPGSGAAALAQALDRHGAWFAALGPRRAVEGACADLDNLVVACRRACSTGHAERAAAALEGAWAALALQGPFQAGVELAAEICALPGLQGRAAAQAHAVWGQALAASGRRLEAAPLLEAALRHAREAGDTRCEADVGVALADLRLRAGDAEAARAGCADALALARQAGDVALECEALNGLGSADHSQGRMQQAEAHWATALALARQHGHRRWQGSLLGNLGNVQASLGRLAQAQLHCAEALALARELGDRKREGNTLCNLGMLQHLQGQTEVAAATLEAALAVARLLGHVRLECIALGNLGTVYGALGRDTDAVARYESALAVARRIGDRRTEGQFLGHLGLAQARRGDFDSARQALQEGAQILTQVADRMSLALLLCGRAECEWLARDDAAAVAVQAQAAALAADVGAGPESELGAALARIARLRAGAAAVSR
jgi:predicted ATPase/class 3 adenylate cyclase